MTPDIFWIPGPWPGRLAISARPRGGDWLEDEVRGWRGSGIDVLVSLLTSDEEAELGLESERALSKLQGIRFVAFPVLDRGIPTSLSESVELLTRLRNDLESGKTVAVHCRQGIGRSALLAAGALIASGVEPDVALRRIERARGIPVPETPEQKAWVESLPSYLPVVHR